MIFSNSNKAPKKKHYEAFPETAGDEYSGQSCSICGMGILEDDQIARCPCCGLPYHFECWEENNGCGSYGCPASPEVEKTQPVAEDTYVEGWIPKKKCPECGELIQGNALICKNCKSKFPTEKPMTVEQWRNRQYEESELLGIRLVIIAQFIASSIGTLSIIMVPANLIFLGSLLYNYKRLPSELKLLSKASFVVSAFWLIFGFVALIAGS